MTKSLNIDISSKKKLSSAVDLFYVVRVILFTIYRIYESVFHFSEGGKFEVLKLQYFKLLCQRHIENVSNDGTFC